VATAPFQLWLDGPSISTAIRVSSTVTVTTFSSHGIVTGSYVQLAGFTGAIGTTMNGVYPATVTSGTSFTVSSAGSAGTAVTTTSLTSEVFSYDLLNPLNNYANADRGSALFVPLESISMSASGDGEPAQINFTVVQQDTPGSTPWFISTPDQTRIRLVKADTGAVPATGQGYFRGFVQNISAQMTGSGQGTTADVTGLDANALLDRIIVYGTVR
jgi:hypothetical protein